MTGRTRWRRFAVLLLPSLLAVGGFGFLWQSGVLAASVVYQSGDVHVSTRGIYGIDGAIVVSDLERYDGVERTLRLAIGQAVINELCVSEPVLGGTATIQVTAGDGDPRTWEISANTALVDASAAKGAFAMDGAVLLGTDATTVEAGPLDLGSKRGYLGIEAGFADARGLSATGAAVRLSGIVSVPNVTFKIVPGGGSGSQCSPMAAPTYNGVRVDPPVAGSVTGVVRDGGGNPIPDVRVALVNAEGELNSVRTDAQGRYTIYAFVGKERLKVHFTHRRYAERWNGGATSQADAPLVAITSTTPITGMGATMPLCPSPAPC